MIFVSIVEDNQGVREGLAALINGSEGFKCVGNYQSCEDALIGIESETPDVMLMDIGLPGMSGIAGVRLVKSKFQDIKILMLTVYENNERVFDAICAGADGYLLKNVPPVQLLQAIKEIQGGGAAMSPIISRKVLEMFQHSHGRPSEEFDLSQRELEILQRLVQGNSYKVIAESLFVSVHTVHFHIKNIYRKLHVSSKSEAVAVALRHRFV
ncbi:MAG: response regulator transcription factor [Ignavibacteriales bacterium]|nr:response regulator transcription factor [Ignavibacteriales bacterium]